MVQQVLEKPKIKLVWLFKTCPKCLKGGLYYDTDIQGEPFYSCLQCGCVKPIDKVNK